MRRTVVLASVVAAALVGVGGAAAIASAMAADATGHVVDVEPLWGDSPAAPVQTPSPTPSASRQGSSPVSVPPHESEDVGDDHGGSSGHGGDDSGDDSSGHGGSDD